MEKISKISLLLVVSISIFSLFFFLNWNNNRTSDLSPELYVVSPGDNTGKSESVQPAVTPLPGGLTDVIAGGASSIWDGVYCTFNYCGQSSLVGSPLVTVGPGCTPSTSNNNCAGYTPPPPTIAYIGGGTLVPVRPGNPTATAIPGNANGNGNTTVPTTGGTIPSCTTDRSGATCNNPANPNVLDGGPTVCTNSWCRSSSCQPVNGSYSHCPGAFDCSLHGGNTDPTCGCPSYSSTQKGPPSTADILGKVYCMEGSTRKPLPGVQISFLKSNGSSVKCFSEGKMVNCSATTDANGSYTLGELNGSTIADFVAGGYVTVPDPNGGSMKTYQASIKINSAGSSIVSSLGVPSINSTLATSIMCNRNQSSFYDSCTGVMMHSNGSITKFDNLLTYKENGVLHTGGSFDFTYPNCSAVTPTPTKVPSPLSFTGIATCLDTRNNTRFALKNVELNVSGANGATGAKTATILTTDVNGVFDSTRNSVINTRSFESYDWFSLSFSQASLTKAGYASVATSKPTINSSLIGDPIHNDLTPCTGNQSAGTYTSCHILSTSKTQNQFSFDFGPCSSTVTSTPTLTPTPTPSRTPTLTPTPTGMIPAVCGQTCSLFNTAFAPCEAGTTCIRTDSNGIRCAKMLDSCKSLSYTPVEGDVQKACCSLPTSIPSRTPTPTMTPTPTITPTPIPGAPWCKMVGVGTLSDKKLPVTCTLSGVATSHIYADFELRGNVKTLGLSTVYLTGQIASRSFDLTNFPGGNYTVTCRFCDDMGTPSNSADDKCGAYGESQN